MVRTWLSAYSTLRPTAARKSSCLISLRVRRVIENSQNEFSLGKRPNGKTGVKSAGAPNRSWMIPEWPFPPRAAHSPPPRVYDSPGRSRGRRDDSSRRVHRAASRFFEDIPHRERPVPSIFFVVKAGNEAFPVLPGPNRRFKAHSPRGTSSEGEGTGRERLSQGVPRLRRGIPHGEWVVQAFHRPEKAGN